MALTESCPCANPQFYNQLMEVFCCRIDSVELKPELRVFYGTVQTHRAIKKKHGTSMFDVFLSKYQTAANLRPPRRFSCITKENIQVGTKRRVLCKKAPKYKVRTARRLLVPKSRRKAYVRVQFTSCLCVCAKKTIARTCPCMHICHTRPVCSDK